jgi:hypothetical protein
MARLHEQRGRLESLVRAEYERCHPEDSLEDLKHRARFSKEDKGLLREWLEAAERRDREQPTRPPSQLDHLNDREPNQ